MRCSPGWWELVSRLPRRLQGLWPLVKRVHRAATVGLGAVFRRTSRLSGRRALPTRATERSVDTAAQDPEHVTVHQGGPAEELVRAMPVGEPAGHAAFEPWLRRTVSARYVLEVRDGLLVGDYAATVAPGWSVLDYETSGYFGISGWREHPLFLRPRLPEPRPVAGTLLSLATRGTTTNYYHFLTDLLPRWGIFEEALPGTGGGRGLPGHAGVVPATAAGAGRAGRAAGGRGREARLPGAGAAAGPVDAEPGPDGAALGRRLAARPAAGLARPERLPRGLYVTRGDVAEHPALRRGGRAVAGPGGRGFTRLDPGAVSVRDQIDQFAAAEVIVAPHGAALANLVFARPGARILELFAPDYVNPCYWAITHAVPDVHYPYLVAGSPSEVAAAPRKPMTGVLRDICIPPRPRPLRPRPPPLRPPTRQKMHAAGRRPVRKMYAAGRRPVTRCTPQDAQPSQDAHRRTPSRHKMHTADAQP